MSPSGIDKSAGAERPPSISQWLAAVPALVRPWREAEWAVLDLETTGLDPAKDSILSIGLVRISGGVIRMSQAWQQLVQVEDGVAFRPESVKVHGLLRSDLAGAVPLAVALEQLALRCAGSMVVAHMGMVLDKPFLDQAMMRCFGAPTPAYWVDTARLAAWFDDNRAVEVPMPRAHGLQRLPDLLQRYGLPAGAEHDALGDALSAAQLFLVLARKAEMLGYGTGNQLRKLG